jgi:predicted HD phosphohydrolase
VPWSACELELTERTWSLAVRGGAGSALVVAALRTVVGHLAAGAKAKGECLMTAVAREAGDARLAGVRVGGGHQGVRVACRARGEGQWRAEGGS